MTSSFCITQAHSSKVISISFYICFAAMLIPLPTWTERRQTSRLRAHQLRATPTHLLLLDQLCRSGDIHDVVKTSATVGAIHESAEISNHTSRTPSCTTRWAGLPYHICAWCAERINPTDQSILQQQAIQFQTSHPIAFYHGIAATICSTSRGL